MPSLNSWPTSRVHPRGGQLPVDLPLTPSILLVDDDFHLLDAMQSTLELNGFDVSACNGPQIALKTFTSLPRVDLLITDFEMPGLSGVLLAEHLSSINPALKVMIVSGALLDRKQHQQIEQRGWCFLSKPFDIMQLLSALCGMLGPALTPHSRPGVSNLICLPEVVLENDLTLKDTFGHLAATPSAGKGKVLLIGDDSSLQRSRRMLLQHHGYTAVEACSQSVLDCPDLEEVQLALLCRSVRLGEALSVASKLHERRPQLPILRFAAVGDATSDQFATTVTNISSPGFLLAEVERLLSRTR